VRRKPSSLMPPYRVRHGDRRAEVRSGGVRRCGETIARSAIALFDFMVAPLRRKCRLA